VAGGPAPEWPDPDGGWFLRRQSRPRVCAADVRDRVRANSAGSEAFSSFPGKGNTVLCHAINCEKERKREKSLKLKEFMCSGLYFESHANRMTNLEGRIN
jgi:hypothetical protein